LLCFALLCCAVLCFALLCFALLCFALALALAFSLYFKKLMKRIGMEWNETLRGKDLKLGSTSMRLITDLTTLLITCSAKVLYFSLSWILN